MSRINFHTIVLGKKASERLRNLFGLFLTLRSRVPEDSKFDIYLDGELLGEAKAVGDTPEKVCLGLTNRAYAHFGGFDSVEEQHDALRKAGYRFKPMNEYYAYPIFFVGFWKE